LKLTNTKSKSTKHPTPNNKRESTNHPTPNNKSESTTTQQEIWSLRF
jgi:hypothetical protein